MRALELKVVTITEGEKETEISYRKQLIETLSTPSNPQGADYKEMSKALPIIEKLEAAKDEDTVLFEAAEWEWVKERMQNARWGRTHRAIHQMVTDVAEAPETKVEAVKDAESN